MNKFTMELVWHNCETNPPKEATNDFLIMTDGIDVFEAFWYRPDGFMIHAKHGWHGLYEDLNKWYWADIRQTVRGDYRFKGLVVDDLVEYANKILSMNSKEYWTLRDGLLYKNND